MTAHRPLRICILASQYFGWGVYGGFGSMSRKLAERLAQTGWPVEVIVPRRKGQFPCEHLNGVTVRSFSPWDLREASGLLRASGADIFHSQDPTVVTMLAQVLQPRKVHLITCRDPRDRHDWWTEFRHATPKRRFITPLNYLTESGPLVGRAVRRADGVYTPAQFLRKKVQRMYRLPEPAGFMPNLIDVPETLPAKPATPTFTFIARWDKRKRPELFLELARHFPEYRFVAVGQGTASAEAGYDRELRQRYAGVPNLELPGFINRFTEGARMHALLCDTWVFVNTAAREGLPLTFLEAAAYGCAILSVVDPDNFATRFGFHAQDGDLARGVATLAAGSPLRLGQDARKYVSSVYENTRALEAHLEAYVRHAREKRL